MNIVDKFISKLSNNIELELIQKLLSKATGMDYSFLTTNEHLRDNVCLLGLGGSYAYGTNVPDSDIDIRGIATNSPKELLTNCNFEQVINKETDTTIYSFNKMISLLSGCNPNTIEILGLKPEHYIYLNDAGKTLLNNKKLFLSRECVKTFGGYAYAQLRRLDNKAVRTVEQAKQEEHILHSIENAKHTFPEKYFTYAEDEIRLYIDDSDKSEMESEIFMDITLKHYPLRDWKGMWSEMNNIVKDYSKLGQRNKNAVARNALGKHMMHLCRLFMMCIDILEKEEIITYREKEHDFLMSIRNGKYLTLDNQPTDEFYEIVEDYQKRMDYAAENTSLPNKPNYKSISELQYDINKSIVLN